MRPLWRGVESRGRRARPFGVPGEARGRERKKKEMTGGPRVSVTLLTAAHRSVRQRDAGTGRQLGRRLGRLLGRKRVRARLRGELGRLASGPAGVLLFLFFSFCFSVYFQNKLLFKFK